VQKIFLRKFSGKSGSSAGRQGLISESSHRGNCVNCVNFSVAWRVGVFLDCSTWYVLYFTCNTMNFMEYIKGKDEEDFIIYSPCYQ
jgi:hypothetical protein